MIGVVVCVLAAVLAPAASQCFSPLGVSGCGAFLPPVLPSCLPIVSSCGPAPSPLPVVQAPSATLPALEGPVIPLPSPPIPAPRTIGHKCVCQKTIVKPQIIQRYINVPSVQKYLRQSYTPVVENIAFTARPNCAEVPIAPPCGPILPPFLPSCGSAFPPCF